MQALKDSQERAQKAYEEQQKQSYQQALTQIRQEATQLVSQDPNYEAIKTSNAVNDVVDLIEQTFKQDGILLTVEEAANEVEEYLVEELMKLAKMQKIQSRLMPQPKAEAPKPPVKAETPTATQSQQPQMKTLTNSISSSRKLTAKERAMLAFKGEKF